MREYFVTYWTQLIEEGGATRIADMFFVLAAWCLVNTMTIIVSAIGQKDA
jgi:hypothetical protein